MCPCGCGEKEHHSNSDNGSTASTLAGSTGTTSFPLPSPPPSSYQPVSLPNSPDLSPLKGDSYDGPLDMSKTSPVFRNNPGGGHGIPLGSNETPPPSPPENDRDKFRCLYLLVDAAVGQLEELEREKLYKNWVQESMCLSMYTVFYFSSHYKTPLSLPPHPHYYMCSSHPPSQTTKY